MKRLQEILDQSTANECLDYLTAAIRLTLKYDTAGWLIQPILDHLERKYGIRKSVTITDEGPVIQ